MTSDPRSQAPKLLIAAPQFLVADVVAAAEFYRDKLGFEIGPYARSGPPGEQAFFVVVSRDAVQIQLNKSNGGHERSNRRSRDEAVDAYIWVTDAEALWTEFREQEDVKVLQPFKIEPHGIKDFLIEDSSGYAIMFAQAMSQN